MKRLLFLLVLLVLVVGGWAFISPRLAAKRFRDAVMAGDTNGLNAVVDFPEVRRHLEADLSASAGQRAAARVGNNPLSGALGTRLGGAIADPLVERLVSPRGIIALARYGNSDSSSSTVELKGMGYQGPSDFGVTVGKPGGEANNVTFVFHRSGLSWRLARLELPSLMTKR